uniref:Glycerol-3-phosphate acyltransferase PlsY n=1 Tax=Candidatus Kentrum sp. TC TaxID=2126339 RepID=A0A450Z521_9GAMM|nr:MAG: glycerol-3-phosphate acyltransferase PlsY [Candidatus Kentron sp. TC]
MTISTMLLIISMIIAAYSIGSISSAVVVSYLMKLPDPRTDGSGNPGATNVLRLGGKVAGTITLLGDITWPTALPSLATWLLMPVVSRCSSLSAIATALLAPIYAGYIWRHWSNIRNLIAGTETKIGQKIH